MDRLHSAWGLLVLGGLLATPQARAADIPTYGVCYVEYYSYVAAEYGGKDFVSEPFTVVEDAQDPIFAPDSRYTAEDLRIRPLDKSTNLDQVRHNLDGKAWIADRVQHQFYSFAGGDTGNALSGYGCEQFYTLEAAKGFIARMGYDTARLKGWEPKGPHVVPRKSKTSAPAPMAKEKKPAPKPSSGGGHLVIEDRKPTVVPGWDAKVREQLAKESDARAKTAAKTAANDAKVKADVAEAIRQLKAQGRAQ